MRRETATTQYSRQLPTLTAVYKRDIEATKDCGHRGMYHVFQAFNWNLPKVGEEKGPRILGRTRQVID